MLVREDTRGKCGQIVVVDIGCERGEERGDDNGMEREWRAMREERKFWSKRRWYGETRRKRR